jgi:hypothetical protein
MQIFFHNAGITTNGPSHLYVSAGKPAGKRSVLSREVSCNYETLKCSHSSDSLKIRHCGPQGRLQTILYSVIIQCHLCYQLLRL